MSEDYYNALTRGAVREEAERRVREGQPRAEVARLLGVPLQTMAQWAHAGRWRLKDLQRERAMELAGAAAMRISNGHVLEISDRLREAEVEERLAAAALEDARRVQAATVRLEQARALLAEARRDQVRAINVAWGFPPDAGADARADTGAADETLSIGGEEASAPPDAGSAREVPDPT